MAEPSHRPPLSITLHDVRTGPAYEGERGEGVMLRTDRGNIPAILHAFPEAQHAVLWVCRARAEALAGLGKAPIRGWRKGCVTNRSPRYG
jgi:hypothetical protein